MNTSFSILTGILRWFEFRNNMSEVEYSAFHNPRGKKVFHEFLRAFGEAASGITEIVPGFFIASEQIFSPDVNQDVIRQSAQFPQGNRTARIGFGVEDQNIERFFFEGFPDHCALFRKTGRFRAQLHCQFAGGCLFRLFRNEIRQRYLAVNEQGKLVPAEKQDFFSFLPFDIGKNFRKIVRQNRPRIDSVSSGPLQEFVN